MLFAVIARGDLGKLQSISGVLWSKCSANGPRCAPSGDLFILKGNKNGVVVKIPVLSSEWAVNAGGVGNWFDLLFHHVCISCLSSARVAISFPVPCPRSSLPAPSPAGQEAERSGRLKETIPPSLSLSLPRFLSITKPLVHFDYLH